MSRKTPFRRGPPATQFLFPIQERGDPLITSPSVRGNWSLAHPMRLHRSWFAAARCVRMETQGRLAIVRKYLAPRRQGAALLVLNRRPVEQPESGDQLDSPWAGPLVAQIRRIVLFYNDSMWKWRGRAV